MTAPDDSPAFHLIPTMRDASLFIFGDHASRHIPADYQDLGLSGDDLTRHIAWDIGTETVIRELCTHFGCAGQIAGVSRLVIDLNRAPDMPGLIPVMSDGTLIPGNEDLSDIARQNRIDRFYAPYHQQLNTQMDAQMKVSGSPFVISVHSFTPHPQMGARRETDIGLLTKHDFPTAERFQQSLNGPLRVDINEPYSAYDLNYTIDANVSGRGLRHLAIEIRQDHIATDKDARDMAQRLAPHIAALIAAT